MLFVWIIAGQLTHNVICVEKRTADPSDAVYPAVIDGVISLCGGSDR